MKKIIIVLGLILFSLNCSFAAEPVLLATSNHNPIKDYYQFDGDKFTFIPPTKYIYKAYLKEQRKFYKQNILKNHKLLLKAEKSKLNTDKMRYYSRIVAKNGFHTPALFGLLNLYIQNNDCEKIIIIANQLYKDDNYIDKIQLKEVIAHATYTKGDYANALPLLLEMENIGNKSHSDLWKYKIADLWKYEIADSYYNIYDDKNAIKYFKLINNQSENYAKAQNSLYMIYFEQKNYKEALIYAKELCKLYPSDAGQYMRVSACSSDNEIKLNNYYTARKIHLSNKNNTALTIVDELIAKLEQRKIDDAIKNLKSFVAKPDWSKIIDSSILSTEPIYWSNRQYDFFNATNNCISKYSGNELIKCFTSVNDEQNRLSLQREKELELKQQREIAELQLMQQERAIQQEQINAMNIERQLRNINYSINRPQTYYHNSNYTYKY